jgi:probable selenium-dependent hydroxylase accessory protein YqeC
VTLATALGVGRGIVCIAGAGGKTTLLYRLASEAHAAGCRVLVTTTTHMGRPRDEASGPVLYRATDAEVREALAAHGRATLLGEAVRDDKVSGLAPERVEELAALADLVLVEADGARRRSFKIPADHEPVMPASTVRLIVVAGLDVLGQPLDDAHVHRLERVAEAASQAVGTPITEDTLAAGLLHSRGYLSRVRAGAHAAAFLNKAEDELVLEAARRIAVRIQPPYDRVVAGSAATGTARLTYPTRTEATEHRDTESQRAEGSS